MQPVRTLPKFLLYTRYFQHATSLISLRNPGSKQPPFPIRQVHRVPNLQSKHLHTMTAFFLTQYNSGRKFFTFNNVGSVKNIHALIFRSEEHTSELQSLMRISYAVFCLKKKKYNTHIKKHTHTD